MSFILDALKKSDAKRRAQLGPDLAAPAAHVAGSSSQHSKPLVVWGLIGLVGILLIGGGLLWFGSDQRAPHAELQRAQSMAPIKDDALERGTEAESHPPIEANEIVARTTPQPTSSGASLVPAETEPTTVTSVDRDETPAISQLGPASALPAVDPESLEALEVRLAAVPPPDTQEEMADVAVETAESESVVRNNEPEEVWQPEAADYLYQWELPLTVRQSLPALDLLVHVYSKVPEERFVLINGTRFKEGDDVSPGVRLAEIRPEGALIDFRDYRFLLSQ